MFPKSFIIAFDVLKNKLSKDKPVPREEILAYVADRYQCTELFFNKIQSIISRAYLITIPLEQSASGKKLKSKKLLKIKDISALELLILFQGPFSEDEVSQVLKPTLMALTTANTGKLLVLKRSTDYDKLENK
jgi:hypothetical protein